jgi:hypothetical protein
MSDGTQRVKVVENTKLPDLLFRDWKKRWFNLPFHPFTKWVINNNAYLYNDIHTGQQCAQVTSRTFKKLSGKSVGHNVKFVSLEALKAVCGG